MNTPFDELVTAIRQQGYYDQRSARHVAIIDRVTRRDLQAWCPPLSGERLRIQVCAIIAHRGRMNCFDRLERIQVKVRRSDPESLIVATVLVGVAQRVLNVPDRVSPMLPEKDFEARVLPRLSSGDQSLWSEFPHAISINRALDPKRTIEKLRQLRTRHPGHTHVEGYDYVLFVPVEIDNVNPPRVARENDLGIDVDADYKEMLSMIYRAYRARWHT